MKNLTKLLEQLQKFLDELPTEDPPGTDHPKKAEVAALKAKIEKSRSHSKEDCEVSINILPSGIFCDEKGVLSYHPILTRGGKGDRMLRAPVCQSCGPGSFPERKLSLFVLFLATRVFSTIPPAFLPSVQTNQFQSQFGWWLLLCKCIVRN